MTNPVPADWQVVGMQFTQHYYRTFDTNRSGLTALYSPDSMLTFEGEQCQGVERIVDKLVKLSFTKVAHEVIKTDIQPCPASGGIIVFVIGNLVVDDNPNKLQFAQVKIEASWVLGFSFN
eukprot:Platyproteum_vivax@DN5136_c0_g1_i2.p1